MKAPDVPYYDPHARCAEPKPTKLDALLEKEKHRAARVVNEANWKKAIDARDGKLGFVCRWSGQRIVKSFERRPDRAERHHIESRRNQKTRYDVRNGFLCSHETHLKLEAHTLQIVAGKRFLLDGRAYWNANGKLQILDTETGIRRWV